MTSRDIPPPLAVIVVGGLFFVAEWFYSRSKEQYMINLGIFDSAGNKLKGRHLHNKQELEDIAQKYLGSLYQGPIW